MRVTVLGTHRMLIPVGGDKERVSLDALGPEWSVLCHRLVNLTFRSIRDGFLGTNSPSTVQSPRPSLPVSLSFASENSSSTSSSGLTLYFLHTKRGEAPSSRWLIVSRTSRRVKSNPLLVMKDGHGEISFRCCGCYCDVQPHQVQQGMVLPYLLKTTLKKIFHLAFRFDEMNQMPSCRVQGKFPWKKTVGDSMAM